MIRSLGLGRAPELRVTGCAQAHPLRVHMSVLDGIAPEPLGDPRGIGRGVSRLKTVDPKA